MEYQFKKNVKVVVNFEIGEMVYITGWGYKMDGKHKIEDMKTNFGGCESGILVLIKGKWLDLGWINKIE